MDGETLRLLRRARDVPAHEADLAALYRDHRPGLVRLAVLLVGDQETAEDVVQDVFTRLHGLARPGTATLPYVRTCVLNGSRSVLRRRALTPRRADRVSDVQSAEVAVLIGESRRKMLAALARLPRRQREALVLRYYLDLSDTEIAAVTLAATGLTIGLFRPAEVPREQIMAMALTGVVDSGSPEVIAFFCMPESPFPSCAGQEITEGEREELLRMLTARPEVESVTFRSQQEAYEDFVAQESDRTLADFIRPGDLPMSYRARIKPDADAGTVAVAARDMPGVSQAFDVACWVETEDADRCGLS
ncbi:permease-like cell division protein FtsX [Herbidospora cretacea]|uniref:permease-like cell division protein FtsX n=1 Tax=Herbidospora cretacea TaxID=28444 RepID=UPI0007C6F310|nr:permease-like cell division protein FtsX [Herbidospora cretacea]